MEPTRSRTRYRIDPTEWVRARPSDSITTRQVAPSDRDALAHLLLDAYAGTIDDEGETIDDAFDEIDGWFSGTALLDHSCVVVVDDEPVAACLVDVYDSAPWIAYVFTGSAHTGRGLGRAAVDASVETLAGAGHRVTGLLITDGNIASERIFAAATPVA